MKNFFVSFLCGLALVGCSQHPSVQVTVNNPLGIARSGEMVEISADMVFQRLALADTAQIVIYNEQAEEVPYQLTYDSKIVFPASVDSCGVARYIIQEGTPALVNAQVFGRHYPERLDDIAWENDKSGYRLYGPAILNRGDQLYGYDVFTKSVPDLVLEDRYERELDPEARQLANAWRAAGKKAEADSLLQAISYHVDHGTGMDVYDVGPTLGAGLAVLMTDSVHPAYSKAYQEYEILDNGPLRFTVKLTFAPLAVNGDSVVETRYIQLDRGALLNKTTVSYDCLSATTPIAAGIVLHQQHPDGYVHNTEKGYVAYADSTNNAHNDNGVIYVGVVFPQLLTATKVVPLDQPAGSAIGHVMGVTDYQPGDLFTYYWGSGWSKAGIPSVDDWTDSMERVAAQVRTPLEVFINEE